MKRRSEKKITRAALIHGVMSPKEHIAEFFVRWDGVRGREVRNFTRCLDSATTEAGVQRYLEANPHLLIQHLGGGHGRWVMPQKRLGAEYVTDFVIGDKDSMGFDWQAVELESPRARMFNKSGDPSAALTHAIRQVQDWRAWLKRNQAYAARERDKGGLGLIDISPNVAALILIGRRKETDPATNERRRQMSEDLDIELHTFDHLVDALRGRVEAIRRWAASGKRSR